MAPRGEAREQAILDAAVELIAEVGYERLRIDAIAARAHASKATMYRRWPGKAELVAEAVRRAAEGATLRVADTGSTREDLLAAVKGITRSLAGTDGPSPLGLLDAIRSDPTLRGLVRAQIERAGDETGTAIVARAAACGERIRAGIGPRLMELAVSSLFLRALLDGAAPDPAREAELVDEVLLPLLRDRTTTRTAAPPSPAGC